jgi:septal ring factor EnvC (AmiA/AmiB activator)
LAAERARQAQAAASLDQQIHAASAAQAEALDESSEAAQAASVLAAKADDLRSAIAAMDAAEREAAARAAREAEAERAAAAKAAKYAAAQADTQRHQRLAEAARARQAALSRPAGPGLTEAAPKATLVAGRIVRNWGAPSDDGPATGITYGAAPGAYVTSPCTGRVAFAAPFRSYGRLMIIECGGGYDFVLAGMARLDAPVGRAVRPGEPIGRMPDYDPAHTADKPGLYVELRRNGQAINPMPYLNGKA